MWYIAPPPLRLPSVTSICSIAEDADDDLKDAGKFAHLCTVTPAAIQFAESALPRAMDLFSAAVVAYGSVFDVLRYLGEVEPHVFMGIR